MFNIYASMGVCSVRLQVYLIKLKACCLTEIKLKVKRV